MLPISHQYLTHTASKSRPHFSHLNFGTIWKYRSPPSLSSLHFELWTFGYLALTPPLLDFFHNFVTFLVLNASLKWHRHFLSSSHLLILSECFILKVNFILDAFSHLTIKQRGVTFKSYLSIKYKTFNILINTTAAWHLVEQLGGSLGAQWGHHVARASQVCILILPFPN